MKKILLVEDDSEYRTLLSKKLKTLGYFIYEAKSGQEGLQYLKSSVIDLILLDLVMLKMDGLKFYQFYKKISQNKTPILILSNIVLSDKDKISKKKYIVDYIIKSNINLDSLTERIKTFIN